MEKVSEINVGIKKWIMNAKINEWMLDPWDFQAAVE